MAAPLRCFLGDISNWIENHHQKQHIDLAPAEKSWNRSTLPSQIERHLVPAVSTPELFRLMGIVVELKKVNSSNVYNHSIVLDDGTGLASIQVTYAMVAHIHVQTGMCLDCITRLESNGCGLLIAEQLVVVQDKHAEALRWLELTYQKRNGRDSMHWGFPTRQISPDDIFRLIVIECQDGSEQISKPKGVSTEDLAECLDLSLPHVESMIEDLRNSGRIYRNEDGFYLLSSLARID